MNINYYYFTDMELSLLNNQSISNNDKDIQKYSEKEIKNFMKTLKKNNFVLTDKKIQ